MKEDAGGRRLLGHDRLLLLRHGDLGGAPLRGLLLVVAGKSMKNPCSTPAFSPA